MKKPPQNKPAIPPPDDPGKRSADWENLGEEDPVSAARKRLEALESLRKSSSNPEEHTHEHEKSGEEDPSRDQGQSEDSHSEKK